MKATQFIKEHGVKKAREVVEGAPELAFGYDFIDDDYFDGSDIQDGYSIDQCDGCVCIDEIKSLVESVDLVEHAGGLKDAKKKLEMSIFNAFLLIAMEKCQNPYMVHIERIKQAIADYESIYGEGNETN